MRLDIAYGSHNRLLWRCKILLSTQTSSLRAHRGARVRDKQPGRLQGNRNLLLVLSRDAGPRALPGTPLYAEVVENVPPVPWMLFRKLAAAQRLWYSLYIIAERGTIDVAGHNASQNKYFRTSPLDCSCQNTLLILATTNFTFKHNITSLANASTIKQTWGSLIRLSYSGSRCGGQVP